MKKLMHLFLLLISIIMIKAQETSIPDFNNMSPQQRREYIKGMSPEQRKKLMEEAASMAAIKKLQIPEEKQEVFKKLFSEYVQSQKAIKDKFKPSKLTGQELSDEEAKKMLDQSFDLGQQLLNNRRLYTDKFLKILTPQQVLKLFNHERQVREKLMDRTNKKEIPPRRGPAEGRE